MEIFRPGILPPEGRKNEQEHELYRVESVKNLADSSRELFSSESSDFIGNGERIYLLFKIFKQST